MDKFRNAYERIAAGDDYRSNSNSLRIIQGGRRIGPSGRGMDLTA